MTDWDAVLKQARENKKSRELAEAAERAASRKAWRRGKRCHYCGCSTGSTYYDVCSSCADRREGGADLGGR